MWERHRKKILLGLVVASFLMVRYGVIERGDVKAIVTDIRYLVKWGRSALDEFVVYVKEVFSDK